MEYENGHTRIVNDTRYGNFMVWSEDKYVSRSLSLLGEYAQGELDEMLQYITPNKTVIEIGANIGAFTIPFAKHARDVIAFEPQTLMFNTLVTNVMLNSLGEAVPNVRMHKLGVYGLKATTRKFIMPYMAADNPGAHFLLDSQTGKDPLNMSAYRKDTPLEWVQTIPYDDLRYMPLISDTCLVKIDVEGSELEVLRGLRRQWKYEKPKEMPVLFIETDKDNSYEIHDFIRSFVPNPKIERKWYSLWNDDNFFGKKANPFVSWEGKEQGCTNTIVIPNAG